nr:hypothetical protein Itr_chr10CG16140 [Ipomoea trifida]
MDDSGIARCWQWGVPATCGGGGYLQWRDGRRHLSLQHRRSLAVKVRGGVIVSSAQGRSREALSDVRFCGIAAAALSV